MRRIAIINQKGGVGKTTTTANLGAALAIQGRRVVLIDMDAQANLSLALGVEARSGSPTTYSVLTGDEKIDACLRATKVPGLRLLPSNIDLSGAELELASAMGREYLLRDALKEWDDAHRKQHGRAAADYVLFDCPPSLGLLSINALAAASEVLITLQTEFLALQGMSKLVEIVALLKKRLNPDLVIAGIVPTLYDIRLKLAREVLGEIRRYFKEQVVPHPIRANVKLAEAPSFAQTIFEYAPDSHGALDYAHLARVLVERESRDADFAGLPAFDASARLPVTTPAPTSRRMPPPRRPATGTIVPLVSKKSEVAPTRDTPVIASSTSKSATDVSQSARTSVPAPATEPAKTTATVPSSAPSTKSVASSVKSAPATASKSPARDVGPAVTPKAAPIEKQSPAPKLDAPQPTAQPKTVKPSAALQPKSVQPKTQSTNVRAPDANAPTPGPKSTSAPKTNKTHAAPTPQPPPAIVPAPIAAKKPTAKSSESKSSEIKSGAREIKGGAAKLVPTPKPASSAPTSPKAVVLEPPKTNGAHAKPARDVPPIPPRTQAKTLKPVPRTARVDDIPPLPPDAFEILSTPIDP